MKLYKYSTSCVTANADPYTLHTNFSKIYENTSFYNPTNKSYMGRKGDPGINPLDGIKIDKIFSGKTVAVIEGQDCAFHLDINLNIFSERTTMINEFIFTIENKEAGKIMMEKMNFSYMTSNVFDWDCSGESKKISIMQLINDVIMKNLFPMHTDEMKKIISNIDPSDPQSGNDYREKMKELTGLTLDACGTKGGMESYASFMGTSAVLNDSNLPLDESFEKQSLEFESEYDLYYSKKLDVYACSDEKLVNNFISEFKKKIVFRMIYIGHLTSFDMWSVSMNKKAEDLINNLENKNEVFWQKLRTEIEEWQLNFLSQNTSRMKSLTKLKLSNMYDFGTISNEHAEKWKDEVNRYEKEMKYYLQQIQYGLDNIATPGNVHDEQRLQKESEITNERILLLSFLAMSIPMLGAIFSPNFSLDIKIISAIVLLSLPTLYFSFFRLSKRRKGIIAKREELIRNKNNLQKYINLHYNNIEEAKNNDRLASDIKKSVIDWEEENIRLGKSMIEKIDNKLK